VWSKIRDEMVSSFTEAVAEANMIAKQWPESAPADEDGVELAVGSDPSLAIASCRSQRLSQAF